MCYEVESPSGTRLGLTWVAGRILDDLGMPWIILGRYLGWGRCGDAVGTLWGTQHSDATGTAKVVSGTPVGRRGDAIPPLGRAGRLGRSLASGRQCDG